LKVNELKSSFNTTDAIESEIALAISSETEEEEIVINYDTTWKLVIEEFYLDFMEFFLPDLFVQLDTSVAPVFLNQELLAIQKELNIPKQITDRLIKVQLLDGTEKWVLVHIEVQTKFEIQFSTRMYLYQAFIYAKHRLPITALAIFTTAQTPKYFNVYQVEYFGTKSYYHYNAYRIAKQNEVELIASSNIFSLFVLAHFYVIQTTPKKYEERFEFKAKLYDLAAKKQIPPDKIDRMLIFVKEIIVVPIEIEIASMKKMKIPERTQAELDLLASMEKTAKEWFPDSFFARKGMTIEAYDDLQARLRAADKETILQNTKAQIRKIKRDVQKIEAEKQKIEAEKQEIEQKAEAEKQKAEAEKQKAEAEKQKAETEKQKAETEKQKAEAEKQKAEQKAEAERQKAEAVRQKAEAERQKMETEKLHQQIHLVIALNEAGFDAPKIALIQQSTVPEVEYILQMYQQKKLSMPEMMLLLKPFREQIK
jgi:hypothetical protein